MKHFHNERGFTLIEALVVMAILAIISTAVVPQTGLFQNSRKNLKIFTSLVTKVFDDSYLNARTNYLAIHLRDPMSDQAELGSSVFSRKNGLSVLNIENNLFIDSKRKLFKHKKFPESFSIEEVILANGEKISSGNVLVPFHPNGTSDDIIVHVLLDGKDRYSVRINKYLKEPHVIPKYINQSEIFY